MGGSCCTLNASPSPLKSISTAVVSVNRVHRARVSSLTQAHDRQSCSGAICTVVEPAHCERDCEGKMRRWSGAAFISTEVLASRGTIRLLPSPHGFVIDAKAARSHFIDRDFPHPPTHSLPSTASSPHLAGGAPSRSNERTAASPHRERGFGEDGDIIEYHILRALPRLIVRSLPPTACPNLLLTWLLHRIGSTLADTLDDLISSRRIEPQLAMKVLANFDEAVARVLAEKVKARMTFKVSYTSLLLPVRRWSC